MNAFYNWKNVEIMAAERMKEIRGEADRVRMLHDAGFASAGERTMIVVANTLVRLGERLQRKYTHAHQAYQTTGGKYAV